MFARSEKPGPAAAAEGRTRLSALDAAFLYFERPNQLMQVGCVAEVEGTVAFARLSAVVSERLAAIPRYRQRPVRAALDLDRPAWEDDPDFDVRRHIRHVALPAPGDARELHALVDQIYALPLDPNHPLWDVTLIDGLADGRSAVVCKVHHCMVDGVSGAQLLGVLTDPAPGAAEEAPALPPAGRAMAAAVPRAQGADGILGGLGKALGLDGAVSLATDALEIAETVRALVMEPNTPLPFHGHLSDRRRIVSTSLSLEDLHDVRGAAGCKVNDVVLAIIAGALHRYLEAHGVDTTGVRVRVVVPVSMRNEENRLSMGNLVTAMLPTLPVGRMPARERLQRVAAETSALKGRGQPRATARLLAVAAALPALLEAALGRFAPEGLLASTVCTNVPGPRDERWLAERRVLDIHPIVPLFQNMGLEFAVMSYASRLSIAATADAALVPDPERIAAAVAEAARELCSAVREPSRPVMPAAGEIRVADLMAWQVATLRPHDSLLLAHRAMRRLRIRHLPVVDGEQHILGIVSHRDLLAAEASSLGSEEEVRLRVLARAQAVDVMEAHVSTASPEEPAAEAGERMIRRKIGCLPVVGRDGRLVGIITAEDYLRWATEALRTVTPRPSACDRASTRGAGVVVLGAG
jgi:diacylglycerol O-acyltransferase / wax synthase